MATSVQLLILCWTIWPTLVLSRYVTNNHLDNQKMDKQLEDAGQVPLDQFSPWSWIPGILFTGEITLTLVDVFLSLADTIKDRILSLSTTEDDLLDSAKRLEDLTRPDDQSQFKNVVDDVMRALIDMQVVKEDVTSSEWQTWLRLDRARLLNSNIVLLMDGLIGQRVTASNLLDNIQQNLKCDVVKMWEKMERYNDLISNGSMAFNHFSRLGQMSTLEWNRRTAAVKDHHVKIVDRNIQLVNNCFKQQLNATRNDTTTQQVGDQIAKALFKLYPSIRWIIAVHINPTSTFKPQHSADYAFYLNGYHIALFPFSNGQATTVIDGQAVDEFCRQPIREAGGLLTCNVASNDGEFIYNGLRHRGIIPERAQLIVMPSFGQLSITTIPSDSLLPFFAKRYPHFDIVAF